MVHHVPVVGVLHVHSSYSHDGHDTPERLHEWAAERGISFIALSDHAEDLGPDVWPKYVAHCRAASDESVQLIPGLEFRFARHTGLHLLALGLERWIAPRTPAEFIAAARGVARLTVAAHPVLPRYELTDAVRDGIDAVEVWNAQYNTRYLPDPRAIRLLHAIRRRRPEVVGTVGLDQHDAANDRETRVVVSGSGDPLDAIRAGRFTNRGRTMGFDAHVRWSDGRMRMLETARWAFDHVERTQDRLVRALARR